MIFKVYVRYLTMQNVGYEIQLIYKARYIKIVLYLDIKCIPPTCTNFLKYIYLISLYAISIIFVENDYAFFWK